jgi:DNA-binding FrmR family transcriptional regulator
LRIVGGQIKGLEKMLSEGAYCIEIINQSRAVREALLSLEKLLLKNHLTTHVIEQVKAGKKNLMVKEILSLYQFSSVS